MSYAQKRYDDLDARSSFAKYKVMPAMALIWATHVSISDQIPSLLGVEIKTTESQSTQNMKAIPSQEQIIYELRRVFDELTAEQIEAPPEISEILYNNLWDLYE